MGCYSFLKGFKMSSKPKKARRTKASKIPKTSEKKIKLPVTRTDSGTTNKEMKCLQEIYKLAEEDESVKHLKRFSDDELGLMVVRAYDCNAPNAWRVLKSLQLCATEKYPELFAKVDPEYLQHVFDMKCFEVLKRAKNEKGPGVLHFRLNRWDQKIASPDDLIAAGVLYVYQMARDSLEVQRQGIVILLDIEGFLFAHAKHVTFDLTTKIQHCLTFATPVKLLAYVVINPKPMFERVYEMMKHLVPEKTRENVYVSKSDYVILHEVVAKEKLPISLGGLLEEENAWQSDIEDIIVKDVHFKKIIKAIQDQIVK